MADEQDVIEEQEVEEIEQVEEQEEEPVNEPAEEIDETEEAEEPEEDEGFVVEVGEEPAEEPEHITELRRRYREQQKQLKELQAKQAGETAEPELPPKPTLESCDYDTPAFERKLEEWYVQKREHDARERQQQELAAKAEQRWQERLAAYDAGKEKLGAKDYDEAEATVTEILAKPFPGIAAEDVRIGIIKQGAKDPATLVYALGKNPAKAKELADIDDPVEFAFALGELSGRMKVVRNGKAPPPERKVNATAPGVAGAVDDTLDRLRAEAAKTGDFSKVTAYKRQKRA